MDAWVYVEEPEVYVVKWSVIKGAVAAKAIADEAVVHGGCDVELGVNQ